MDPAHDVPLYLVLPFAILLLCIAVLPLAVGHWWEHNKNKGIVATVLSLPVAIWLLSTGLGHKLPHTAQEYVSFIVLLGSLFTISGGIFVDGDLRALPRVNTMFLALGAVLASVIGTTGASMLLIRPLLRTNSERKHVVHTVIFFIFIVSNCGGCLTPLGDPPLFLGYLHGVPFLWTLRLWPVWASVVGALLAIYFVWDTIQIKKETAAALKSDVEHLEPISVHGKLNFLLLIGVVAAAALVPEHLWFVRDGAMLALAAASMATTSKDVRAKNAFSWGPIIEVAVLFAGIFVTMIPALMYLEMHGASLGVDTPQEFFWWSGSLSSFLDNAPTYLTFSSVACGLNSTPAVPLSVDHLGPLLETPTGPAFLRAIALGSVFMGANSYIGNGPNFMVKAIADSSGVKMPSFFGYMMYSVGILIPIFIIVTFLAF
ncbi:MAG: sodium:proton antiporter [Planctomycetes bacterium]|nr:sodium:proton antiporter [Planctomycetota bacterium]